MTEGLLIQRNQPLRAVWVPGGLALFSLVFGVWRGPVWVAVFSGLGLILTLLLGIRLRFPLLLKYVLAGHVLLLLAGFLGYRLFLKPLSSEALQLPPLTHLYKDPDGLFELRGPRGWDYERLATAHEAGVRMRPREPNQYMGVSEVTVLVRKLDRSPSAPRKFLETMASQMATASPQPRHIQFHTESIKLLNGDSGLLGRLTVRRLWVPLSQVGIYGIKGRNKLCTVAASGLERHSILSKVLCLGLMQTLKLKTPL